MGSRWATLGRMPGLAAMLERAAAQIEQGPPEGLRVSRWTWKQFVMSGGVFCPADKHHCKADDCCLGTCCAILAADKGTRPSGEPLPRRDRPACEARTRAGGKCQMAVEPGKIRCRLHGGKSTGPRTIEGRDRIAAAQRRRWGQRLGV